MTLPSGAPCASGQVAAFTTGGVGSWITPNLIGGSVFYSVLGADWTGIAWGTTAVVNQSSTFINRGTVSVGVGTVTLPAGTYEYSYAVSVETDGASSAQTVFIQVSDANATDYPQSKCIQNWVGGAIGWKQTYSRTFQFTLGAQTVFNMPSVQLANHTVGGTFSIKNACVIIKSVQ